MYTCLSILCDSFFRHQKNTKCVGRIGKEITTKRLYSSCKQKVDNGFVFAMQSNIHGIEIMWRAFDHKS